ncbi:MAG: elongation factor [Frankiaceae bacterium]|nr:elongation factor [Frankiaceae bacterium]
MSEKRSHPNNGSGPAGEDPGRIRNIAVVGPSGAGKTTLIESLLAASGTVARQGRVEDGTTVCDFDESEVRLGRSVSLALAPLVVDGVKVNLLDTPGFPDFIGETRAALRAADAALFVVSATDGIEAAQPLWEECLQAGLPVAVILTKLDSPRADFAETVAQCRQLFGDGALPAYLPMYPGSSESAGAPIGLLGLLTMTAYDYSTGECQSRPADDAEAARCEEARNAFLEGVIAESEDETLMDRYLDGEPLELDLLTNDLERAVARGRFFPLVPAIATSGVGIAQVLELLTRAFPPPVEHGLPAVTRPDGSPASAVTCDASGPLLAEVVKTTSDPYVGRISLVRVFSGTLRPDEVVHVSGHGRADAGHRDHDDDERTGLLTSPLGAAHRPVPYGVAGDIVAVAKLSHAETGDTLSGREHPLLMQPWDIPEPLLPVAVSASSKADEDKLSAALVRLAAEDTTVRLEQSHETGQLLLWCMGEAHVDLLLDRLARRHGVHVDRVQVKVPLRETLAAAATAQGRHVKQSGGHGQYAVCTLVVEPLPSGSGVEFADEVVGGAVPRAFIPSVEKGARAQLESGVRAGVPIVDVRVRLIDGKAHSVDSSDMAFQLAAGLAIREAAHLAGTTVLEPIMGLAIVVPDRFVGAVMSDLSSRRSNVLGSEPASAGHTVVHAEMPESEVVRYAVGLRAATHGTGTWTRAFARWSPVPPQTAAALLSV